MIQKLNDTAINIHPTVAVAHASCQAILLPLLSAIIGKSKNPKNEPTKGAIYIN